MENKTAVEWLFVQLDSIKFAPREEWVSKRKQILIQAKAMEHQQQVDLLKFSKEMCTPEAPIDYIIKEFNKYGKQ